MAKNEIHFRNTDDCIKKIKSIRTMYRDTTPSYVALSDAIQALEEIQQCREYKEIFESHFSEEALKLLSNKEEFGKWLERGRWIAKKCDEINRELKQYRAIGAIGEFKDLKEKNEKQLEAIKLLTIAAICYEKNLDIIRKEMKENKELVTLYCKLPTVQYIKNTIALSKLADSDIDVNNIESIDEIIRIFDWQ